VSMLYTHDDADGGADAGHVAQRQSTACDDNAAQASLKYPRVSAKTNVL
jgi:hypothetical protein